MTKKEKATTKRARIRKCPFCKKKSRLVNESFFVEWYALCDTMFCWARGPKRPSAAKAAKAWNGVK